MKFKQCSRCGLSLPLYLLRPVRVNGKRGLLCNACLKIVSENAQQHFKKKEK